ncbi:MAG: T9SS type A sorting domain-containing protein, partial [Ignavibacteriaceae bacterium]|nr:T9SS type A sorting domain-containing protein [Ignavibacteriaceae bacterium]
DKQWMTIDKTDGPGTGHNYSFWTSSYSVCYPGFFTRSTDGGGSFEDCITIPGYPFWGTLAVGPEGELYIGGSNGSDFLVVKSTNAQNSSEMVTWDMTTVVDLDGSISNGHGPNPGGLLGQTLIATDTSNGPYHGNVYLLCSVDRKHDPLDVMFVRSTDGGVNWSSPNRVNDDPNTTAYQWFGTMSVAPNGRIDVVWLDTRDNLGTYLSALYYSKSTDGGVTWSPNERFSDYFDPHVGWPQQNKMGDYFDMVSDSNGAYLAWAATFNGEQDVYYSYITDTTSAVNVYSESTIINSFSLYQNYPNPFNPSTVIGYQLPVSGNVSLKVYDVLGNLVSTLVDEYKQAGVYEVEFSAIGGSASGGNAYSLASGIYFYQLKAEKYLKTKKMLFLK